MITATSAERPLSFSPRARRRARGVALFFALWGIFFSASLATWGSAWPLVLFYALLVLNTYFSVRAFASITPKEHLPQQCMDALLGIELLAAPFFFNAPFSFILVITALFITATLKYIFLVPVAGFSRLLYMKIRVDTLGILLCFLALTGTFFGYPYLSTVLWAFIFLLANIYVLWLKPHYHLHLHTT